MLVDTGATRSVLNKSIGKPSNQTIQIQGVSGETQFRPLLEPLTCQVGQGIIKHQFLYVPDCPVPLLGRDLLNKLKATISFDNGKQLIQVRHPVEEIWRLMIVTEEEVEGTKWQQFNVPLLWAEDNPPGFAKYATPVMVELKPQAYPVRVPQRYCTSEAAIAIQELIQKYLIAKIIRKIQSPWNTAILPVRKPDGQWRPVQDLRPVNKLTLTLHATVPNPYILLSTIPASAKWFSVVDLKDAFFTIPLAENCQPIFAFEWANPKTQVKTQYTWTRLPQGFKNSPTCFGQALAQDLAYLKLVRQEDCCLQYVDDVLITGQNREDCFENTSRLLRMLQDCGYRVSKRKAQLVQMTVMYLGYELSQGQRTLGPQRKQAVLQIPIPQTKQEVRAFLGITGFCRIWIPNFALTAKPLYQVLKGPEKEPLLWQQEQTQAMKHLQQALTTAPALGLPDISRSFSLYVDVRQNVALGVLTQKQGNWNRPVAYLSKQLDMAAQGWPQCLKILAAVMLLLQEANKLTFSAPVAVCTSHALQTIIDNKGHLWISNQRMHKIQALLLENPQVTLQQCSTLNPATLMPIPDSTMPVHNCMQTIELQYSCRPDLTDQPLHNPDFQWFTDGSSFMDQGIRYSGYAIVSQTATVESAQLPSQASAQFAELYALTRALEIAAGMILNVYTDSKYAFLTIHAHAAIYKERGYLDSTGKIIQYATLIKRLIKAAQLPSKVAIIHCPGHQKDSSLITQGNRKADKEAKRAALEGPPSSRMSPGSCI